tara:strand:- start:180 stop:431 length:252 start_codon:yes stop_codon:yes gene_type:complete
MLGELKEDYSEHKKIAVSVVAAALIVGTMLYHQSVKNSTAIAAPNTAIAVAIAEPPVEVEVEAEEIKEEDREFLTSLINGAQK